MTTTAFDDQFVSATETILALNVRDECQQVHDLQVRLAAAIQRATDAEAEMAKLREQAPAGWVDADGDFYHGRNYPNVFPTAVPVYAATVPAPAVPELDPMTRLIVSDPKQLKPKKQEPAVPSVVFMAHNKTSSILFAARKDADQYAASFGPAAGVSVTECAVIGSQSAPQAPAVPELDPMTRLIVSDPKQLKPKKQKPAVPEFCAVEAQLTLAETEMLNAKAWSPGTQAKRHIDFAMTAICCASALLQSAEVTK